MSYQGFVLSNSQTIRNNTTHLILQGRLSDGKRFHWTVTRPGLVFFIERRQAWTPPGAFRKNVELKSLRGIAVDALYFQTFSDLTFARKACESRNIATYEADINLTARFLMERFIKGAVRFESQPVKIAHDTIYFVDPQVKGSDQNPPPNFIESFILYYKVGFQKIQSSAVAIFLSDSRNIDNLSAFRHNYP